MGNQLASVCRDYIGETLTGSDLWKLVQDEIETEELPAPAFKISKKGSKKKELIHDDDKTLTGRCDQVFLFWWKADFSVF